jgi:hypothetical protein
MTEPAKILTLHPEQPDDRMIVQLSVAELRKLIAEEVKKATTSGGSRDHWVDIARAAEILTVSPDWIYHNVKKLPFAKKIGRRQLRFSVAGMQRWMEGQGR